MMAATFPHQLQVKPIRFFKIITTKNIQDGKLMIPIKFVKKYGEGLPNTLFLKTPNGTEWNVNLEKLDGKIWFQKGWKEFAEYHSLAHGHLLVFRCDRTSHFQVHIFDLSALEIHYPSQAREGKTQPNNPNEENLEYDKPSQKRKDKYSSLIFLQPYQMRSCKSVKVENTVALPEEALHHTTDKKCKEKSKAAANQVTAFDRASSFKPCNPFFLVVMRPSYVDPRARQLALPRMFCRRHFGLHKKKRLINLQVLNGRVNWSVKFLINQNKRGIIFRLGGGWTTFSMHNNLKVGDVCIFELIDRTKLTFMVHIFRETDSSNCSTSQESSKIKTACQGQ